MSSKPAFTDQLRLLAGAFRRLGAAVFLLAFLASSASGQMPRNAGEMLSVGVRNLHARLQELLPTARDASSTLAAVRQLTDTRRVAQRAVALDFPLDDFIGILVVDQYDEAYVGAVDTLTTHYLARSTAAPDEQAQAAFRDRLGDLPPVNDTPAAYVISYIIGRFVSAGSNLPESMSPAERAEVAEVAVHLIGGVAAVYRESRSGDSKQASDEAWHRSVIERVRCPQHHCSYKVAEERNGLKADGSLYRRYIVTCEKGGEERKLDFDLGAMGNLLENGGYQVLKKPLAPPTSRMPGVEP